MAKKVTALVNYDEELAKQAQIATALVAKSGAGGKFFSVRNATLAWEDTPIPGNQLVNVAVGATLENAFYKEKWDPENPRNPTCFAFGDDPDTMRPHPVVFERGTQEHDTCKGCPQNEWGSADVGKGKACRNVMRIALIPAGTIDRNGKVDIILDEQHYADTDEGYLKVPVTSVKYFAGFVREASTHYTRPPHGVFNIMKVEPAAKENTKVSFATLEKIPNDLIPTIMKRHTTVMEGIDFPYPANEEAPKKSKVPAKKKYTRK